MQSKFLETAKKKTIIYDGAMGTSLFSYDLTAEDYGGEEYEGCPEQLNFSRPDIIKEVHRNFYKAGADIVETNTFGAAKLVMAEYGLEDKSYEVSKLAASLAREVADEFNTKEDPGDSSLSFGMTWKFVAGSVGPGTKLSSLGDIKFQDQYESYLPQMKGLIDGGVDVILIETCQDPLQIKAAINAAMTAFEECGKKIPLQVQVTIETMGTLLVGTDIAGALTTLASYPIDILGMNCATGPKEMRQYIKYLAETAPFMISCLPNAGIPENHGGHAHFPLGPEEFSDQLSGFVKDFKINVVGGCCGTTYEHIKQLKEKVSALDLEPKQVGDAAETIESVSSVYNSVPMLMEPKPLIVGERTNANGSKLFRNLLGEDNYDAIVDIAKEQLEEGSHVLDVCTAYVGRDETKDMVEVLRRVNTQVNIPIMVDSTELPVLEESLKYITGKPIINSVNIEDGEERVEKIAKLTKQHGAALVVLTIDEDGMAKTAEKKIAVTQRIYDLLVNKHGVDPRNLIFDALTFTLASGDEDMRDAGIQTIEGIRLIKEKFPEVKTILGLSNISFGLDAKLRPSLNSVFLHECIQVGLDMVIASARKLMPMAKIEPKIKELCLDLIYDKRRAEDEYDPLHALVACAEDVKAHDNSGKDPYEGLEIEEILANRIIDGNKKGLEEHLDVALAKGHKPLTVINEFLMNGMKVVGERFRDGEMQLPFVLQSATTMKASVAHLEQFMDKSESSSTKGTIVLATVKGDVHDIGKNLVDIILTNNGYTVHNIGIKQPVEAIVQAIKEHDADVVGMSGLLVKSTLIMKQNLEVMNDENIELPVILGGSALTRRYVEEDCAQIYKGTVFYGFDAFTDLSLMEKICTGTDLEEVKKEFYKTKAKDDTPQPEIQQINPETDSPYDEVNVQRNVIDTFTYTENLSQTRILDAKEIPETPFVGDKLIESNVDLDDVWHYMNKDALIIGQWRMGKGKKSAEDYKKQREEEIYPLLERVKKEAKAAGYIQPKYVYGYYKCQVDSDNPNRLIVEDKQGKQQEFIFPRQAKGDYLCLTDYFKGKDNLVAFQVVTIGEEAAKYVSSLYNEGKFDEYLYHYGLATETTEALAEYCHAQIRKEWGYEAEDNEDMFKLVRGGYHGLRYSFGYPACPRIEDQKQLFDLLKPDRIGLELSEEWQIHPEHSTSAIVVHHPDAKYFNI